MTSSISEKFNLAAQLATDFAAAVESKDAIDSYDKLYDTAYAYIDGLRSEYIANRVSGRCSVSDLLNFDLAREESTIDSDIRQFENALRIFRLDYVCHKHQTLASKCCLNPDDYCRICDGRKTVSVDGKHCRMCDW
jgi:hypothetical protein